MGNNGFVFVCRFANLAAKGQAQMAVANDTDRAASAVHAAVQERVICKHCADSGEYPAVTVAQGMHMCACLLSGNPF